MTLDDAYIDHLWAKYIKAGANVNVDVPAMLQKLEKPAVFVEQISATSIALDFQNIPTKEAYRIITEVLPDVLELFLQKNADYGEDPLRLGAKGAFADIWRKVKKLKRAVWDDQALTGEQPEEIYADLIGHCLNSLLDYKTSIG